MTMSLIEMEKALKQLRLSGIRATLETRVVESQAATLQSLWRRLRAISPAHPAAYSSTKRMVSIRA